MVICVNGQFVERAKAKISVFDHGFLYGDGFYDTMRIYNGIIFEVDLHLRRIARSMQTLNITLPWSMEHIAQWLQEFVRVNNLLGDASVRMTVTRGSNGFNFQTSPDPTLVITGEPYVIKEEIYTAGLSTWTMQYQRPLPEIKHLSRIDLFAASQRVKGHSPEEILFIGAGNMVREAATANVFIVKHGVLQTPVTNILHGLTRSRVIQLAAELGYTLLTEDFPLAALEDADEIFLSSRLRGIAPVTSLCGRHVGDGKVGGRTKTIMDAYHEYVQRHLREQKGTIQRQ